MEESNITLSSKNTGTYANENTERILETNKNRCL